LIEKAFYLKKLDVSRCSHKTGKQKQKGKTCDKGLKKVIKTFGVSIGQFT
jgi:hypothetical protein